MSPTGASPQKTGSTEVMNIPFYSLTTLILLLASGGERTRIQCLWQAHFRKQDKGKHTHYICMFIHKTFREVGESITSIQMCS